jgi:hypothetical protein
MFRGVLNKAGRRGREWYFSVTSPADVMAAHAEGRVERGIVAGVRVGLALSSLLPALLLIGLVLAVPGAAHAQAPGDNLFGSSNQTVGNGIRSFTRWFRVFIFFAGVVGLGVCGLLKMIKQPWGGVAIGSAFCFGFAGVAQLVYSFSNGQDVEFNPDLGN